MAINSFTNDENPDIILSDVLDGQVLVWDNTANALVNATFTQGSGTGEANDAQNLGVTAAREGIFANKIASTLRFKSLVAGTNITLSSTGDEITINSTGGSGSLSSLTGVNAGSGSQVFKSFDGTDQLDFRTLTAGNNITITQSANEILIAADDNAGTLNNLADTAFVKVANNLSDVTAGTARTNLDVYSKAEADGKFLGNNKHNVPDTDAAYDIGSSGTEWRDIYARRLYGTATHALTADSVVGFNANDKLDTAGGTLTGALTLSGNPTQALHAATKQYVDTSVNAALDGAPGALDTLNELAAAIGDDANFAGTMTTSLAGKLSLAGGTMSGDIDMANNKVTDVGAPTAGTDAANKTYVDTQIAGVATGADLTLSNISNVTTARTNLGLGTASTQATGSFLQVGNNLSDLGDASAARTALGLGSAALSADTVFLKVADNLSTLANPATARTNLGLGTAATSDAADFLASNATTTLVTEGTNLYYTDARFDTRFGSKTTDNVNEGTTNLYYTNARADARIGAASVGDLSDVDLAGAVNGSILVWNATTNRFEVGSDTDTGITQGQGDARYFQLSATNVPDTDGTYDIGSNSLEYRNIYARKLYGQATTVETINGATGGTVTGDFAISGNLTATGTVGGTLDLSSSSIGTLSDVYTTGAQNTHALKWVSANSRFEVGAINSDEITEGSTNLFFTTTRANSNFDTRLGTKTSDDIAEGSTNQYFTTARGNSSFDARLGTKTTDELTEGSTNLYFTNARAVSALTGSTTDNIAEGTNNQYFTNARADARADARIGASSINALSDVDTATNAPTVGQRLSWNGTNWVPATDSADFSSYSTTTQANNLYVGRDATYIPNADGTYDLGSNTFEFRNIYARKLYGQATTVESINGATGGTVTGGITASGAIVGNTLSGEIAELGGPISITGSADVNDVLTWNGTAWTALPAQGGGGGGGATTLGGLTDVNVNAVADNKVLAYNATNTQYRLTDELELQTVSVSGRTLNRITGTADVTGTGVLTNSDTITIDGTTVTFTASTANNLTDLVALIEAANITDVIATATNNRLVIDKTTGADITIAGTGTILTDVGLTAGTIARTASTALNVVENANIDGTLRVQGNTTLEDATLNGNATVSGNTTLSGTLALGGDVTGTAKFTDTIIEIGKDSTNTSAIGIASHKGTDNRTAYITWSKTNNRWDFYYSDEANAGAPFTTADLNGNMLGTIKGFNYPATDGTNGQVLTTDGSGNFTFTTVSGGGGGGGATTLSGLTDVSTTAPNAGEVLKWTGSAWAPGVDNTGTTINSLNDIGNVDTTGVANGSVLKYNSTSNAWEIGTDNAGSSLTDTDGLSEGSTNLYFTDARADARITAASLSNLSNVATTAPTTGQVLKWNGSAWAPATDAEGTSLTDTDALSEGSTNLYYTDARVDTHLNQSNPTAGYVLSWNGSDYAWIDNAGFSGNYNDLTNKPTIPSNIGSLTDVNTSGLVSGQVLRYNGTNFVPATISDGADGADGTDGAAATITIGTVSTGAAGSNVTVTNSGTTAAAILDFSIPQGTAGATGAAGSDGADGTDGADGADGVDVSSATITGDDLIITLSDSSTVNAGNVRGPQGDQGITGNAGADGSDGSDGAAATIAVGNVTTGAVGSSVTVTNTGSSSAAVFDFAIPQGAAGTNGTNGTNGTDGADGADGVDVSSATISGDNLIITLSDSSTVNAGNVRGPQGTQGNTGTAGNDGAAATITVGTVTTGAAGTNATVTNSGSSSAAVFDIAIPRGASGTDGADGADGIQLTDISVGTEGSASGNGGLTYAAGTGVFTYTPPVLSGLTGDTDDISEGSTNQYYTDARADARIGAADLSDLNNIATTAPTDGQALVYSTTNSRWEPGTVSGGGGGASELSDLSDANITSATEGQILRHNGLGVFVNQALDLLDLDGISDGTNGQVLTTDGSGGFSFTTVSGGGGGGGSGTEYEEFKINYATNGNISTISDTSSGVSSVNIDSAAGGDITVTFTGYTTPPVGIIMYGYNYAGNEYNINTLGSTGTTLRAVPGGGSSGSPTAFGSFATLKLKVREAETGASRSFGTVTHAWVRFTMGA